MFIGHYGVALAAKKLEPKLSLGWLFVATQFVDILWTIFVFAGVEHVEFQPGLMEASPMNFVSYPYTHSLLMSVGWGVLVYVLVYALPIFKALRGTKAALIMGVVTVSHWFLDLPVHGPDLPLAFGNSTKVGFGLWNSMWGSFALECAVFLGGLWVYLRATKPDGKRGKYAMIIFCAVILANFIPIVLTQEPPPSQKIMAITGFLMFVVFAWIAGVLDKRRVPAVTA